MAYRHDRDGEHVKTSGKHGLARNEHSWTVPDMSDTNYRKAAGPSKADTPDDSSRIEMPERSAVPLTQATQIDRKRLFLMTSPDATISHS